tara:strand:+ start:3712 stop:3921 length:210 start_codon:yes stop_codon:yes gene_type:complete
MVHVATNVDCYNPDVAHDTEWEIKQLKSAIAYYNEFANSTASREERYELDLIINRLYCELHDLKDEHDV